MDSCAKQIVGLASYVIMKNADIVIVSVSAIE
jgi:hypothetical protein